MIFECFNVQKLGGGGGCLKFWKILDLGVVNKKRLRE